MNQSAPLFSICIPNYNYAHYLRETVESVLNQDFEDFEIVIVDNCSTDNSWELMQQLAKEDQRIRIFRNEYNIGFAPNLQAASSKAKGKYINLLSADDNMSSGALSRYKALITDFSEDDLVFLFSDTYHIDSESTRFRVETRNINEFIARYKELAVYKPKKDPLIINGHKLLKHTLGLLKNPAPFLSVVYSKSLWEAVGGYNAPRVIGPDKYFNYKALSKNPTVIYVREPLFEYRVHLTANAAAQKNNTKQQIDDYLNILDFQKLSKEIGVKKEDMIRSFLNRVCYKSGIQALLAGNVSQSKRCRGSMFFFPKEAYTSWRFYLLYVLNLSAIISVPLLKVVNRLRK